MAEHWLRRQFFRAASRVTVCRTNLSISSAHFGECSQLLWIYWTFGSFGWIFKELIELWKTSLTFHSFSCIFAGSMRSFVNRCDSLYELGLLFVEPARKTVRVYYLRFLRRCSSGLLSTHADGSFFSNRVILLKLLFFSSMNITPNIISHARIRLKANRLKNLCCRCCWCCWRCRSCQRPWCCRMCRRPCGLGLSTRPGICR